MFQCRPFQRWRSFNSPFSLSFFCRMIIIAESRRRKSSLSFFLSFFLSFSPVANWVAPREEGSSLLQSHPRFFFIRFADSENMSSRFSISVQKKLWTAVSSRRKEINELLLRLTFPKKCLIFLICICPSATTTNRTQILRAKVFLLHSLFHLLRTDGEKNWP